MKKAEIKKLKKERERLEKKAAKQQAKVDAQERKRMRGESNVEASEGLKYRSYDGLTRCP
jgi:hypothetical protein